MDIRLKELFIRALKIKKFNLHECTICGFLCHWHYKSDQLHYENNCCGSYRPTIRHESELDFYLNPDHGHVEKIKNFVIKVIDIGYSVFEMLLVCPECKKELTEDHISVLRDAIKVKHVLGDNVGNIEKRDLLCNDCHRSL